MKKRVLSTVAVGVATVLALAGCASSGGTTDNGDKADLTIGVFSGWAEGEAVSYLWQQVLEEKGYNVKLDTADAGPVFTAVSKGDYDVTFDVWLPNTHKKYWEKYSDKLNDLGAWYKEAPLTVAVNKDAPIDSLEDLAANADKFDNKIVGIEPGAGLTAVMKDSVIPKYGLDKMEFQTSSTAAMLSALKKATSQGDNIVVTLWKPHWAYDSFPIKDLKDPKNALGDPDSIHTVSRLKFGDDYPTLEKWLKNFEFDPDLLANLEAVMFKPDDSGKTPDASEYPEIVKKWMGEHEDFVKGLTS